MSKLNCAKQACFIFLLCAATATALPAQTYTVLHSFDHYTDGDGPFAELTQATDGKLYGTTNDIGTVFSITPSGALTTLYTFCSQSGCTDGSFPDAGLIQATDGNLYGTTLRGGANNNSLCSNLGCGTVFKITSGGTLTTLYSFCSQSGCTDGANPEAVLVQGTDGSLYGTTDGGGANSDGTVFKITPSGTLTTLHSFDGTDGASPGAGLVQATDGNFYGTTYGGGANGYGTVFKITPNGTVTTLYSFCSQTNCTDGANPEAELAQATNGNLYGTTYGGGTNGRGTVFKITPSGTLTRLLSFDGADGASPRAGLVQATDGNFYGTTSGQFYDSGTVFKITPSGALTTLHSFCSQSGCTDGSEPLAGLVQATDGTLYGTTVGGGANNFGTVFSLSVGLGPFVETQPTHGPVGRPVKILGTNLTGATSVTFNGSPAVFTLEGHALIVTRVPAGATSGKVQVLTPSGTLTSNVPFRVFP